MIYTRPDHAIAVYTLDDTRWHLRRVGALERAQIDADLMPLRRHAADRMRLAPDALAAAARISQLSEQELTPEVLEHLTADLAAAREVLEYASPPVEALAALYATVASIVVRLDGVRDQTGEAIAWRTLSDEDRYQVAQLLTPTRAQDLVASALRGGSVSDEDRPL